MTATAATAKQRDLSRLEGGTSSPGVVKNAAQGGQSVFAKGGPLNAPRGIVLVVGTPVNTPTPTATVTPTGTLTPTATVTATPVPVTKCSPRPNIGVTVTPDGVGRLRINIAAHQNSDLSFNLLRFLRFGTPRASENESIDFGGQIGRRGTFTIDLSSGATQAAFTVRQVDPSRATTVHLVIADDCGDFPTFVGGGPTAFTGGAALSEPANGQSAQMAATPTVIPAPAAILTASACSPSRRVAVQTQAVDANQVQVTVSEPADDGASLRELRFGNGTNARVTIGGQTRSGPFTYPAPSNTSALTFTVARIERDQPMTAPLVVVDTCGEWPTFVGAGAAGS